MSRRVLATLVLVLAGCAGPDGTDGPGGLVSYTPPLETPWLMLSGTLQSFEVAAGSAVFRFAARYVDCELDPRVVEVTARIDDFFAERPFVSSIADPQNATIHYYNWSTFSIDDPLELVPGTIYLITASGPGGPPENRAYTQRYMATFHERIATNGSLRLSSPEEPRLGYFYLGDPAHPSQSHFVLAKRPWRPADVVVGGTYYMWFARPRAGPEWVLERIDDAAAVARECSSHHWDDITLTPHDGPLGFPARQAVGIDIVLRGRDDQPVAYRADEALLVSVEALDAFSCRTHTVTGPDHNRTADEPPRDLTRTFEICDPKPVDDRVESARVAGCDVASPAPGAVSPNATVTLRFMATCDRDVTAEEAAGIWLWGTVVFTDEVGAEHVLPDHVHRTLGRFRGDA